MKYLSRWEQKFAKINDFSMEAVRHNGCEEPECTDCHVAKLFVIHNFHKRNCAAMNLVSNFCFLVPSLGSLQH